MRPNSPFFAICLILALISSLAHLPTVRAEVIKAHEPRYAEAVLAYNARNYDQALKILEGLLKESPELVEFLELKALALKSSKNDPESTKTYEALIRAKEKAGAKAEDLAPYHFELGVIRFRAKDLSGAEPHFQEALLHGFNRESTSFFLGMITFQNARFAEAGTHFEEAASSRALELKIPSLFYLAQTELKIGDSSSALSHFSEVRTLTTSLTDDVSKAVYTASNNILTPLDQSKRFASLALSLAYDSNVQALPNSLDGTLAFNKGSLKNLLQAGFGYMSSPTRAFQWVPNYRLLYNYNYNRETREGEFLGQYLSLYLNHRPLEKGAWGLKSDLSLTFQNQFDEGSTTRSTYRIFSSLASLGAYYRLDFSRQWSAYLDASFGPQKFNGDATLTQASERRTGSLLTSRLVFSRKSAGRFLNPSFSFSYTGNRTEGTEFYSNAYAFGVTNGFQLTDQLRGALSISHGPTFYPNRPAGERIDRNSSVSVDAQYQFNPKWTLISDASVGYNQSNVSTIYEYRRWTFSMGASYSFY